MDLNQITIPSRDVKKSVAFYQKLGLNLIVHAHDAYARFECPGANSTLSVHLVDKEIDGPGVIIYFEVPDVAMRVAELQAEGIEFDGPVRQQSWLWTEAHLKDPDGNQLIIYHAGDNRKNPPWRIDSKQ